MGGAFRKGFDEIMAALKLTSGVLLTAGLCLLVLAGDIADAETDRYINYAKCGPNSLFLFLILSGHSEVMLHTLENIPISYDGASLLHLRNRARTFGVKADIRRYGIDEIDSLALPAIGQFITGASNSPYHFNVIYKVDKQRIYFIDGTSGLKLWAFRSSLPGYWTGLAMTKKSSLSLRIIKKFPRLLAIILTLVLDAVVILWFKRWIEIIECV